MHNHEAVDGQRRQDEKPGALGHGRRGRQLIDGERTGPAHEELSILIVDDIG